MNRNRILLGVSLVALLLTGCSDSGSSSVTSTETDETNTTSDSVATISLSSALCVTGDPTSTDIANYETLQSGDTVVKEDDNATVIIYQDSEGGKKICLVDNSSSAYISR